MAEGIIREVPDEAQTFSVAEALRNREGPVGRVVMANSPNSFVGVFEVAPRGGETRMHAHPDSDQILYVLEGQMSVVGVSGERVLNPNEGVLVPAGVNYGFINRGTENMIFLTMRTESSGGRYTGYVKNVESDAQFTIPADEIAANGPPRVMYMYILDHKTIGVSPLLLRDWSTNALVRMNCRFERHGDDIVAVLPERIAQWFNAHDLTPADYSLLTDPDKTKVRIDLSPLLERQITRR